MERFLQQRQQDEYYQILMEAAIQLTSPNPNQQLCQYLQTKHHLENVKCTCCKKYLHLSRMGAPGKCEKLGNSVSCPSRLLSVVVQAGLKGSAQLNSEKFYYFVV